MAPNTLSTLLSALFAFANGLNNGLGLKPQMGYVRKPLAHARVSHANHFRPSLCRCFLLFPSCAAVQMELLAALWLVLSYERLFIYVFALA